MQPEDITITLQAPTPTLIPPLFTRAINLHIEGALEQLQWTSSETLTPVFQHNMPGRKLPSAALGAVPSTRAEDPLAWRRWTQPSLFRWQMLLRCPHRQPSLVMSPVSLVSVTHHLCLLCQKYWRQPASPPFHGLRLPPRVGPANLPDEVLWLQVLMNVALEQLPTSRASIDSHHRELVLNTKLNMWKNEAKAMEAIKEAEVSHATMKEAGICCTNNACVLQQMHRESMLALDCKVIAEEGWDH